MVAEQDFHFLGVEVVVTDLGLLMDAAKRLGSCEVSMSLVLTGDLGFQLRLAEAKSLMMVDAMFVGNNGDARIRSECRMLNGSSCENCRY